MRNLFRFYFRKVRRRRNFRTKTGQRKFLELKEIARTKVLERLLYFNQHYGFKYGRVSIRNQTTRWGSCSSKGNLNFNYRIATLPDHLVDYIVVHELCHIGQFNHYQKFWDLVGERIPNYDDLQKELRGVRIS